MPLLPKLRSIFVSPTDDKGNLLGKKCKNSRADWVSRKRRVMIPIDPTVDVTARDGLTVSPEDAGEVRIRRLTGERFEFHLQRFVERVGHVSDAELSPMRPAIG